MAPQLKVLQIGKYYYPDYGGIETYLYNLCMELVRSVEIEVLVSNTERKTVTGEVEGIKVTRVGRIAKFASFDVCPSYFKHLAGKSPDIIHIHCPNPMAVVSYLYSGLKESKLVVTYHSDIVRQAVLLKLYRPFLKRLLTRADRILVHTENHAQSSPVLKPFLQKVIVVPPGIDTELFAMTPETKKRYKEIQKRYGKKIVLFIGRFVYYKGIEYLIEAMKEVSAILIVVGTGALERKLVRLCERENLQKKVCFLSHIGEMEKVAFLHASSVVCLPSFARSEAFGIVQLEGMICGKPVVNTHIEGSGVSSVSLNNETGITVPPRDAIAISKAINFFIDNPQRQEEFGKNGIKRVLTHFRRENTARRVLEIYYELMDFTPERHEKTNSSQT